MIQGTITLLSGCLKIIKFSTTLESGATLKPFQNSFKFPLNLRIAQIPNAAFLSVISFFSNFKQPNFDKIQEFIWHLSFLQKSSLQLEMFKIFFLKFEISY
jgi:hypothetical protein